MRFLFLAVAFSVSLLPAASQDKKPADPKKAEAKKLPRIAINDPAKLKDDIDFAFQGEYEGDKVSIQVIVNGIGKYSVQPFIGGLPKSDWKGERREIVEYKRDGDQKNAKNEKDHDDSISLDSKNQTIFIWRADIANSTLKKIERKSPTLDAKPAAGAIVLFASPDDLSKWDKMKTVKLSDGEFLGVGGRTKQKFKNFTLHVEFRLPWMPNSTGQARANSGVYLQDQYEVQVLDSFGLKGENNECGGIYQIAAPKVNMCYPPMAWQTYDIDFTAAEFEGGKKTKNAVVTIKHNGVLIHDKFELPKNTPGGGITKEGPEPGAIHLQDHGDPVVYRNIWIVEK